MLEGFWKDVARILEGIWKEMERIWTDWERFLEGFLEDSKYWKSLEGIWIMDCGRILEGLGKVLEGFEILENFGRMFLDLE